MTGTGTTVLIPAAGRATRMGAAPGDPPKCLLDLGGTPILQRLVDSCLWLPRVRVVVLVPPDQPYVDRWRQRLPDQAPVTIVPAPPEPYGHTILRGLGHAPASEVAVLDSDLVVARSELTAFLQHASSHPSAGLTVGTSSEPWDLGPRTIWLARDGSGHTRLGRGLSGAASRLIGAYWFRPPAVESLRAGVAAGVLSFGALLRDFADRGGRVDCFGFSFAYDVNTVADLTEARRRIHEHEAEVTGHADR